MLLALQLGIHNGTGVLRSICIRKCLGELVVDDGVLGSPDNDSDLDTILILLSLQNWSAASCLTWLEGDPSSVSMIKSDTLGRSYSLDIRF